MPSSSIYQQIKYRRFKSNLIPVCKPVIAFAHLRGQNFRFFFGGVIDSGLSDGVLFFRHITGTNLTRDEATAGRGVVVTGLLTKTRRISGDYSKVDCVVLKLMFLWSGVVGIKSGFLSFQTNSKAFTAKTSCVRRRYSEFVWLKKQLEKNAGLV